MPRGPIRAPSSPARRAIPGEPVSESLASRIRATISATGSSLCVGLDPDLSAASSAAAAERLCIRLVEATLPHCSAFKLNVAFFEQHGSAGAMVLEHLRARIPPSHLVIIDAKRGDIGNTALAYARAVFDHLDADAVTVNPLMGSDAVLPFLQRPGRGAFLLTRTSNPGAADLLDQRLANGRAVYEHITCLAGRWDPGGAVGLVVGATAPDVIRTIRSAAPTMPLLIPGIGSQGGVLEAAVTAGLDKSGEGILFSVSRAIASADEGPAAAAERLQKQLRTAIEAASA